MIRTLGIFALLITSFISTAQPKQAPPKTNPAAKTAPSKFGALAIDRSNGFYYGWSFDYSTLAEAEQKAMDECKKKGGNCSVVLSYSGTGCAAYRTIDGNVGTAFGWGIGKTKEEADAIATEECKKRSNGATPSNFVWSCNSTNAGSLKELYNANPEIFKTISIGNQIWGATDLDVTKFRNGDAISYAATREELSAFNNQKKPAYTIVNSKKVYNGYAVHDPRGLAPKGYHVPTDDDWNMLVNYLGGEAVAGGKLKSTSGWFQNSTATNASKFTALPGGGKGIVDNTPPEYIIYEGGWWSSTRESKDFSWIRILHYSRGSVYRTRAGDAWYYSVRVVKD